MSGAVVHLGFGANLGDPREQIGRALDRLVEEGTLLDLRRSSFYRTAYVGPGEQPDYYNLCVRAVTPLGMAALHARTKAIEAEVEGGRRAHMAPRKLDIDLLLFDDALLDGPQLRLPHPRIQERRFVLEPLFELDPDLRLPPSGRPVREFLERADVASQKVQRVDAEPLAANDQEGRLR